MTSRRAVMRITLILGVPTVVGSQCRLICCAGGAFCCVNYQYFTISVSDSDIVGLIVKC